MNTPGSTPSSTTPFPTRDSAAASTGGGSASDTLARSGSETGSSSSSTRAEGEDLLDRVVQSAHAGIDHLADSARPRLQRLQEGVHNAGDTLRSKTQEARETGDEWVESLRTSVREHPLAALAAAAALGVLVARLSSSR